MKPRTAQIIYFLSVIVSMLIVVYCFPTGIENKFIEGAILIYWIPAIIYIGLAIGTVLFVIIILVMGSLISLALGEPNPIKEIIKDL